MPTAPHRVRAPSLLAEQGWPSNAEELAIGGFRFIVQTEKVLGFGFGRLDSGETPASEIGDSEGRTFHRPPLEERTLATLFGQPDTIRKWTSK